MKLLICKSKRLFVSAFALAFLVCAAFGQQSSEPQARKFAEFAFDANAQPANFYFEDEYYLKLEEERRKNYQSNLVEYLRQVRLAKAQSYIIGYSPRVAPGHRNSTTGENLAGQIKSRLSDLQYRLSVATYNSENFITIDGGFREQAAVELWIVPLGAKLPQPTPTVDRANVVYCPQLSFDYLPSDLNPADSIAFGVSYKFDGEKAATPVYRWQATGGEIVDGQGTAIVKIKPTIKSGTIRVKVEIQGFSPECPCSTTTAATEANFNVSQYMVDEFGRAASGDMKARLDNFIIYLQNQPDSRAYIISYTGRLDAANTAKRRNDFMQNYIFKTRGMSLDRISFIEGGYREEIATEIWLAKPGAGVPLLTPTIDPKFIVRKPARRK